MPAKRRLAVIRGHDVVAILAKQRRDQADERAVVVDDEHARHRTVVEVVARASGTLKEKTAPPSAASSTQRSPPCPSTTRRDAKRPMPEPGRSPCAAPRAYGSKIRARPCGRTPGPSSCTRITARSSPPSMRTLILLPSGAYLL